MINKLDILLDRFERLPLMMPIFIEDALKDLAPVIEDLLADQLQHGEKGDGSKLPNYSPVSVAKYGKPAGPIRLYETGAFYRGMQLKVTAQDFEIIDTDSKTPMLTERYGDNILLLNDRSLQILKEDYLIIEVRKRAHDFLIAA